MKYNERNANIQRKSDVEDMLIDDIVNGNVILDDFWLWFLSEAEIIDEEQEPNKKLKI